jgi:hypothetical protein
LVAITNLAYCAVEFSMARHLGSAALFLRIASTFLGTSEKRRRRSTGKANLAKKRSLQGVNAYFFAQVNETKASEVVFQRFPRNVTHRLGALGVNVTCARLLLRIKNVSGSLTRSAFLSARNDALAKVAIILAAAVTWIFPSH